LVFLKNETGATTNRCRNLSAVITSFGKNYGKKESGLTYYYALILLKTQPFGGKF